MDKRFKNIKIIDNQKTMAKKFLVTEESEENEIEKHTRDRYSKA